jgi:hypothetical protein
MTRIRPRVPMNAMVAIESLALMALMALIAATALGAPPAKAMRVGAALRLAPVREP